MGFRHILKSRAANVVGAIAALGGGAALIYRLVEAIRSGRGIDRYIAMSGQEWSAIPALVFTVVALSVLVVGGVLRWIADTREEHDFLGTLRRRISTWWAGPAIVRSDRDRGKVP